MWIKPSRKIVMGYQGMHVLLVAVCCMNTLIRLHIAAQVTNRTCTCSFGCDFSKVCSPTPNCTRENVALGKPANMSSSWNKTNEQSGPACLAVNGNINTVYIDTNKPNPNCIHTEENDTNAYWLVDLGRNYTIKNITVYIRSESMRSYSARMDLVNITVDEQSCYQFSNGTPETPLQKDVACNPPRRGSVVRFYKNGANLTNHLYVLNICEVQVWVCSEGFYGEECDRSCKSNCRDDISCDNLFGNCLSGDSCSCSTGCNFTESCTPVGNCRKDNVALGKPANMSSSLNASEAFACLAVNGNTGTVYKPLVNCIQTGLNDRNAWWLVKLGRNYTVTNINIYTDKPQRMAGVVITVDDQACYTFPTDQIVSSSPKVDVSCSTPRKGSVVKFYKNGTGLTDYQLNLCEVQVWVCKAGLYGINCDNKCNCSKREICDNFFGTCTHVCANGFYGTDCNKPCGYCNKSHPCNWDNGTCVDGCVDGYMAPECIEKCRPGRWGRDCQNVCGACLEYECRHDNGTCEKGCLLGYEGGRCADLIQQNSGRDQTGAIVGSVLGAGLFISVAIVAVLIWFRRTSMKENLSPAPKSKDTVTYDASSDMQEIQDLSFHGNVYDKIEPQEDVAKSYTVLQKENSDDNDKHSTVLENNYEKLSTQFQNTSADSKSYERLKF